MASTDDKPTLKITLEDLASVEIPAAAPAGNMAPLLPEPNSMATSPPLLDGPAIVTEEKGQASFYRDGSIWGIAGMLVGALAGWGSVSLSSSDSHAGMRWGNIVILPFVVMFTCLGLGVAESIVERSAKKAMVRGLLGLALGLVGGFIFDWIANIFFAVGTAPLSLGVQTVKNPAFWIVRGLAWAVFGVAGGIIYGLVDRSMTKTKYGIFGGLIGAALGGMVFDPHQLCH